MTETNRTGPAVRRLVLYRLAAELALEELPEPVIVQSLAFEPAAEGMTADELRTIARRVQAEHRRRTATEDDPAVAS